MKKPLKTSTSVNTNLLILLAANGAIKPFALFIKIKSMFEHSIIYNFNYHKIAKLTGLADRTVKLYIKRLIKYNLVEIRDGHLLFRNQEKVWAELSDTKTVRRTIETRRWTSFSGILQRLQCLLIKENNRQQEFNTIARFGTTYRTQLLDGRNKRKAKKLYSGTSPIEKIGNSCFNSSRSIARLLKVSHTTANNVIRNLVKKNYIRTEQIINKVHLKKTKYSKTIEQLKLIVDGLNSEQPGYYFLEKRSIFCHSGLLISFLSF